MTERRFFVIVSSPCADTLRSKGERLDAQKIRSYPDGSLVARIDDISRSLSALGPTGNCLFRSLSPFAARADFGTFYRILFPAACDWMTKGENWVLTYPGTLQKASAAEDNPSRVHALIRIRHRFTSEIARELADNIARWFADVGSRGVFGEGGISSLSPHLRYHGGCAGLQLDASLSGQHTLNTLYLAILNWGMQLRRPLTMVNLAGEPAEPVFFSDHIVRLVL